MAVTKKKLNKRVVAILTISIMLIMTILAGIMIWATAKKDPTIYAKQGNKFFQAGKYKDAIREYQRAFRYSGKDPKWLIKIAESFYNMGEVGRAIGSLKNAVLIDPTLIPAQYRLLQIYYEIYGRNAPPSAMKNLEEEAQKLIDMIPERKAQTDPEYKKMLAFAYHCRGIAKYGRRAEDASLETQALDDIKKAIKLDPQPDYVKSLAFISLSKAQQLVNIASAPDISVSGYQQYIKEINKDIEKAKKLYQSLLKQRSQQSDTLVSVGNFYQNSWGRIEAQIISFCKLQVQNKKGRIRFLNRQLQAIQANKNLSSAQKTRARLSITREIARLKREVPLWEAEVKKHEKTLKLCESQAEKYYAQALKLAKTPKEKVNALLAMATFQLNKQNLKQAEKLAKKAIEIEPKSYVPYQLTVQILRVKSAKQAKSKSALLNEAIKLLEHRIYDLPHIFTGPQGRKNRLMRAQLQAMLAELYLDRHAKDDTKNAQKIVESLEQELGESPLICQLKARIFLANGKLIDAIQEMEKADNISNGRNPRIKFALAKLYMRKGEIGAARDAIESAIKLNPSFIPALRLASLIYLKLGEIDKALATAEKILADNPNDIQALAINLECLVRMGDMQGADSIASKMKKLGANLNWKLQKARILLARGNYTEAESLLKEFLKEHPGDKTASIFLTEIYARTNQIGKAKKIIAQALKSNPKDAGLKRLEELIAIPDNQKRIARLREMREQLLQERLAKSLKVAQEEKDPFKRNIMLFKQYVVRNDLKRAQKYLEQAIKLNPERANIYAFNFALIRKDWDAAEKCIDLAIRKNLDGVKGLLYQARYENARGWDYLNKKDIKNAKKHFAKSVTVLEELLTKLPKDSTVHALLGEGYFWTDRQNEALTQINKALELNPMNPYALRAQSVVQWFELIKTTSPPPALVQAFANNIIKGARSLPYDTWFKNKKEWIARQIEKQKQFREDAIGNIKTVLARRNKILKEHPDDIENLLRLAWIYENRKEVKNPDKAAKYYQLALKQKQTTDILYAYWDFAIKEKRIDKLEKFLKNLASSLAQKQKSDGYSLLGYFYLLRKDIPKAESAFLQTLKISDNPDKRLDLAVFYNRIGKFDKAAEWARKALKGKLTPAREKQARILLIDVLLKTGKLADAQNQINEYMNLYPNDIQGKLYQVRIFLEQDKLSEAKQILDKILNKNPENIQALDLRSTVCIYMWQMDQARKDLEDIKRIYPPAFTPERQMRLIKIYCELGRNTEAEQLARDFVKRYATNPNIMEIFRQKVLVSLSSSLEPRNFEELLAWCANLQHNSWIWSFERGKYWLRRGQYDQAQDILGKTWQLIQKAPTGTKMMVFNTYSEALFRAKLYNKLITLTNKLSKEIKQQSSWILGWQSAAYYELNNKSKAIKLFIAAIRASKNPILTWQVTEKTFLLAAKPENIIPKLKEALTKYPKDNNIKLSLALCYMRTGQLDKGKDLYTKLANEQKDKNAKTMYLYLLAQEFTNAHKYEQAAEVLQKITKIEPNNIIFANNLAYILAEYLNKPAEAEKIIEKVIKKAMRNADILDTYGRILEKLGKNQKALAYLGSSVWLRESAANRYHLALLLLKEGRKAEASIQLERALKLVGSDKQLKQKIRETMSKL